MLTGSGYRLNPWCYRETVKNITVALPEDVYRSARIRAAERDTSVSALVREFLLQLGSGESEFDRKKSHQDEILQAIQNRGNAAGEFSAKGRLKRDAVHDRNALR
jgi:plasmid stability protein